MRPLFLVLVGLVLVIGGLTLHAASAADGDQTSSVSVGDSAKPEVAATGEVSSKQAEGKRFSRLEVLVASLTVFTLAVLVGFEVIAKVPPTLHTPLMSGSNAISGITVVGAIIAAGNQQGGVASFLGLLAVILANINVVGGFLVTHRMLMMFKKR